MADMITKIFEMTGVGTLRVVSIDGEPWFLGTDVGECLGYANPRHAYLAHTREKYRKALIYKASTETVRATFWTNPNDFMDKIMVCEAGLYQMIFESEKECAIAFQDWLYEEVLPSIRKNGLYVSGQEELSKDDRQILIDALQEKIADLESMNSNLSCLVAVSAEGLTKFKKEMELREEEYEEAKQNHFKERSRLYKKIAELEEKLDGKKKAPVKTRVITGMEGEKDMYIDPVTSLWCRKSVTE